MRHRHNHKLQQRSYSVQQEGSGHPGAMTSIMAKGRGRSVSEVTGSTEDTTPTTTAAIDINVIQATPNISPSCSLRSFSVESASAPSADAIITAIENEVTLLQQQQVSASTTAMSPSSATNSKGKVQRRVSFSEEEIEKQSSEWQKQKAAKAAPLRQNTLPTTMSYLTVPGQPTVTLIAPALTVEAIAAQTSVQARKRRSTRLMKAGSFCSITSEGDGDIFAGSRDSDHVDLAITEGVEGEEGMVIVEKLPRKTIDPLLSDYSEFYDNDKSDISDLFEQPAGPSRLRGQRTLSEEYGSIRSLSIDNDDPMPPQKFVVQPGRSVDEDDDIYASSSCSISIESDCEPGRGHQITVPVTIEPPPPEMRIACANNSNISSSHPRRDHHHHAKKDSHKVCQIHQHHSTTTATTTTTKTTTTKTGNGKAQDSMEEIKRVSPAGFHAADTLPIQPEADKDEVAGPDATLSSDAASGMRMVLVRDIGVQVSGDSPNLNLHRRTHKRQQQLQQQHQQQHQHHAGGAAAVIAAATGQRQDSLAEKFPAEILF